MSSQTSVIRVLHVCTGLELGGAERIMLNCAVEGRSQGYLPKIAALKSGGEMRPAFEEQDITVNELGASAALPDPFAFRRLLAEIAVFRPHIVQGWLYHGNLFALAAAKLSRHVTADQLLWGIYNSSLDLEQYPWRMSAVFKANVALSHAPRAIVYNSVKARTDHQNSGFKDRASVIVNNGVDTALFKPDPHARRVARARLGLADDARVAIIVARVDPQKDWATVLRGISLVEGLVTVAVGPTTAKLDPQPGLITIGAHMTMHDLYPAADIFILPSAFGEGTSVAMCEAMSCGLPVIVTDVGDNATYARDAGWVIPSGDPQALANALRTLFSSDSEHARLSANARRAAQTSFGPAASFKSLFDCWESMAARQQPA
jgi:glycosyltransferase involved in cell wall biosynthesis